VSCLTPPSSLAGHADATIALALLELEWIDTCLRIDTSDLTFNLMLTCMLMHDDDAAPAPAPAITCASAAGAVGL
jgi:hypothetical protein